MSNEYQNDFALPEHPDWQRQDITIPLNEWTELLLDNADLRSRLDAMALRWSDANERIRHLENDLAMMRGENAELRAIIDRLTDGKGD